MAEKHPRQPSHDPEAPTATTPGDPARSFADSIDSIESAQALVGDRYRLERLAGAGGMGRVFAASDRVLGRRVAIKLLHAAGRDEASRRLVITEARAMAGLRHPNVCRVHEVVLDAPTPFIVMDWITGTDLRTHTRELDLRARLTVFTKVVDAVSSLHAAGLVHGDLKPTNVLVDERGEPFIVDFGLAASHEEGQDRTSPGGGTPGYAAPERWGPGRPAPNSDVYSLGVMLFELLTGRPPFRGATAEEVRRMAETEHPPLPQEIAPETPEAIQRICLVALEREAARRYADAGQLHADLRRFLAGETVAARPSFLESRFTEQVRQAVERAEEWRRLGMISGPESDDLIFRLHAAARPESPWILDSRRLTFSQVALYLGGWFVVLAMTVGLYESWDQLAPSVRIAMPWLTLALVGGAGAALQRTEQRRVALGYLFTAALVLPAAISVTFRETGWLAGPDGLGMGDAEPFGEPGLLNRQLLVISAAWLTAVVVLRFVTASSAFVLLGVIAASAAWASAWLCLGRYEAYERGVNAELGAWMALLTIPMLPIGLALNRREESLGRALGVSNQKRRDAWPVLTGAILLAGIGLGVAARNAPERFFFVAMDPEDWDAPAEWQALAFIVNGAVLSVISIMLDRNRSPLRIRLSNLLRWAIPTHLLGGLLALEYYDGFGVWLPWLIGLAAASIGFIVASVPRQWKPFLATGLVYLALCYARAFGRAEDHLDDPRFVQVLLTVVMLVLGGSIMALAWRTPTRLVTGRLARWSGAGRGRA
ncbi:MAG: serine/threonine protein kinase [Phycisphaerales bacterium]|nr:serine/threonine protein kinase [Phycisphaerales bacterium]